MWKYKDKGIINCTKNDLFTELKAFFASASKIESVSSALYISFIESIAASVAVS